MSESSRIRRPLSGDDTIEVRGWRLRQTKPLSPYLDGYPILSVPPSLISCEKVANLTFLVSLPCIPCVSSLAFHSGPVLWFSGRSTLHWHVHVSALTSKARDAHFRASLPYYRFLHALPHTKNPPLAPLFTRSLPLSSSHLTHSTTTITTCASTINKIDNGYCHSSTICSP